MLLLLTILTSILVTILIMTWILAPEQEEILFYTGVIFLVTLFFGWGLLGTGASVRHATSNFTGNIFHDKNAIHVSVTNSIVATYHDKAILQFYKEKSEVKMIRTDSFNLYGGILNTKWQISNSQESETNQLTKE